MKTKTQNGGLRYPANQTFTAEVRREEPKKTNALRTLCRCGEMSIQLWLRRSLASSLR